MVPNLNFFMALSLLKCLQTNLYVFINLVSKELSNMRHYECYEVNNLQQLIELVCERWFMQHLFKEFDQLLRHLNSCFQQILMYHMRFRDEIIISNFDKLVAHDLWPTLFCCLWIWCLLCLTSVMGVLGRSLALQSNSYFYLLLLTYLLCSTLHFNISVHFASISNFFCITLYQVVLTHFSFQLHLKFIAFYRMSYWNSQIILSFLNMNQRTLFQLY